MSSPMDVSRLRCPSCETVFRRPARLPDHGIVRCGRCGYLFDSGLGASTASVEEPALPPVPEGFDSGSANTPPPTEEPVPEWQTRPQAAPAATEPWAGMETTPAADTPPASSHDWSSGGAPPTAPEAGITGDDSSAESESGESGDDFRQAGDDPGTEPLQQIETAFVLGGALPRQQVGERRQDQEPYRSPHVADLFAERGETDQEDTDGSAPEASLEWTSEPPRFPEASRTDFQDPLGEVAATPDWETESVVEVAALLDDEGPDELSGATGFAAGLYPLDSDAPEPSRAPEFDQPPMICGTDELPGGADVERAVLVEREPWPRLADSDEGEPAVTAEPATQRRATRWGFLAALLLIGALGLGLLASHYGHQQLMELGPVGQLSGWLHQTAPLGLDYGAWVAVLLLAVVLGASLSVWRSERRASVEPDVAEQLLARLSGNRPRPQVEMLLVVLLALLAVWQLGYAQRDKLLQNPGLRRAITQACQVLGCALEPLTDIANIRLLDARIISPAGRAGVLEVDAALVNDAAFSQPYPRIRLSFQSFDGALVASRTFQPHQYLRGALVDPTRMVAGVPVSLHLELVDPGPAATNYLFDLLPGAAGDNPAPVGR